jgi:nitrous oxidase accessory protein
MITARWFMALLVGLMGPAAGATELHPAPGATLQQLLVNARPGDVIRIPAGTYRGVTVVTVPRLTLIGDGRPTLDGEGKGSVLIIRADGVTVRGLHITHTGLSNPGDDAGIRMVGVRGCTIADNVMDHVYFGVMAKRSSGNRIVGNRLRGEAVAGDFTGWGDGVRLWDASDNLVQDNTAERFRDGIGVDFAHRSVITGNRFRDCVRYGLQSFWSHDMTYRQNTFWSSDAGNFIGFGRHPVVERNVFVGTKGHLGYGMAFKCNEAGVIKHNRIADNTMGLLFDGATRNRIEANTIAGNGWALLLYANSVGNDFRGNAIVGNQFDVAMDMRDTRNHMQGNYWSAYQGYDIDGNGIGDRPHAPVGLFSLLAMQFPDLYLFAHSPAVTALEYAQRLMPVLAPSTLLDEQPLVRRPPLT